LNLLGFDCGQILDAYQYKGEKYFDDLENKYINDIKPNILKELKQYQVAYIIKDKVINANIFPEKLSGTKLIYQDGRFLIYKLNY